MGLRHFFQPNTSAGVAGQGMPAAVAAADHSSQDALTPEDLAELSEARTDLAEAAEGSGPVTFSACSRDGKSWQENPATVAIAALLREHPAREDQTPGQPPGPRRQAEAGREGPA